MWGSSWRCIQFGPHVSVNVAVVPELSRNEIDPSPLCFRRPDRGRSRLLFSMKTQASSATLRDRVSDDMLRIRAELETLVRIPSISHPGHDPSQLGRSAEATAKILGDAGCETKIVEIEGGPADRRARSLALGSVRPDREERTSLRPRDVRRQVRRGDARWRAARSRLAA